MAKKKTARKTSRARVPFQIRLSEEVHERIAKLAEAGGISMNQLTEGLLSGCARHLEHGRPFRRKDGVIDRRDDRGCYFVGKKGVLYKFGPFEKDGPHEYAPDPEFDWGGGEPTRKKDDDGKPHSKGFVWFVVDYSQQPIQTWEQDDE